MRVISGSAKGRKLKTPKGTEMRPTADQIKEAIFNIIQFDVEDSRVLDLFAGTGQMGIEALSRGAAEVVFVDKNREAINLIRENLALCNFKAQVIHSDAMDYLLNSPKFDIIFIDPPYGSELAEKALKTIQNIDLLNNGGIIICETCLEKPIDTTTKGWCCAMERRYGKIKITKIVKEMAHDNSSLPGEL